MATKDEIVAGIKEQQERLERLLPRIRQNLDKPLLTGTWTVHDAVCHIAGDVDVRESFRQRVEKALRGDETPITSPGFNIDVYNQEQIDLRKHKPLDEVVAEITRASGT